MMMDTGDGELKSKKIESTLSTRTHAHIKSHRRTWPADEDGVKVDVKESSEGKINIKTTKTSYCTARSDRRMNAIERKKKTHRTDSESNTLKSVKSIINLSIFMRLSYVRWQKGLNQVQSMAKVSLHVRAELIRCGCYSYMIFHAFSNK